jgi:hypothetical protein
MLGMWAQPHLVPHVSGSTSGDMSENTLRFLSYILVELLYHDDHFDMVIQRVFNIVTIKGFGHLICILFENY